MEIIIWCVDSQVVRAMKRGLKLQNKLEKKRIPYLSVNPFSVSGICSHGNRFIMHQQDISNRYMYLEPAERDNDGESEGQEYVGGGEDCETRLSECADGEDADLPPPGRRPFPLSLSAESIQAHHCQKHCGCLVLTLGN